MNKNYGCLMLLFFNAIFVHVAYSADDFSQETGLLQTADGSNLFDKAESKPATKNIFSMLQKRESVGKGNKDEVQNQIYRIGMKRLESQECISFADINKVFDDVGRDQKIVFFITKNILEPRLKTKDDMRYGLDELRLVNSFMGYDRLPVYTKSIAGSNFSRRIKRFKKVVNLEMMDQEVEQIFLNNTAIEGSYSLYHELRDHFPNLRYVSVSKGVSWSTAGL